MLKSNYQLLRYLRSRLKRKHIIVYWADQLILSFQGSAVFDFTGTGPEMFGNCNAPRAITFSAIIYCLRCMVKHDIPLNQVKNLSGSFLVLCSVSLDWNWLICGLEYSGQHGRGNSKACWKFRTMKSVILALLSQKTDVCFRIRLNKAEENSFCINYFLKQRFYHTFPVTQRVWRKNDNI